MTVLHRSRLSLPLAAAVLAAAVGLFADGPPPSGRVGGSAKMVSSPPFPAEAWKKGIEGNVVLSGVITADGSVSGLEVLASSSPLLTDTALHYIDKWKFAPAVENGKPVPLTINAVVRFRKDRAKIRDTGSLAEPIVGNLALTPADLSGKGTATEGFPIEPGDGGVRGLLDLDLPKAMAKAKFRLVVTDVFPSGKSETILDQAASGTGPIYAVTLYRAIDAHRREEQGVHTLKVTVDGRNAGGARYRVVGGPAAASPRQEVKPARRGVLFDMDGVLVFSTKAWFDVYNDTLAHFGHPRIGREEFLRIFGNGTRADRVAYMPERSVEEIDAAYRRFFADRLGAIELNPEAVPALVGLKERGIRTSLATNTNRRLAESILDRLGVSPLLTALACADEAGAGKPDTAVVRLAARRIELPLEECVLVGDSRYDEEAAAAAPMEFRGYRYGIAPIRIEALSEVGG